MKGNMSQIKMIFQSDQMTDFSEAEVFLKNLVKSYFHHHLRQTFFYINRYVPSMYYYTGHKILERTLLSIVTSALKRNVIYYLNNI